MRGRSTLFVVWNALYVGFVLSVHWKASVVHGIVFPVFLCPKIRKMAGLVFARRCEDLSETLVILSLIPVTLNRPGRQILNYQLINSCILPYKVTPTPVNVSSVSRSELYSLLPEHTMKISITGDTRRTNADIYYEDNWDVAWARKMRSKLGELGLCTRRSQHWMYYARGATAVGAWHLTPDTRTRHLRIYFLNGRSLSNIL